MTNPSLKDEMRQLNLHGGTRLTHINDLEFGYNLSEKDITTILGLVINKVLDLLEMQNEPTSQMGYTNTERNLVRAEITSAIKGLKG